MDRLRAATRRRPSQCRGVSPAIAPHEHALRNHGSGRSNELGALYRPRYFHRDGIAVHGSSSVPAHPASHGCVRVSEPAMDWIWSGDLMPIGSSVWIH